MLTGMLNDICGSDIFTSIYETLAVNLFAADGKYAEALAIVKDLHETVIKPLALMLMFIYFMLAVIDKLSSENFTWEQLWRQMAMLLAAKFLIDHGFQIMEILFKIGMALAADIDAVVTIGGAESAAMDAEKIIDDFKESLGLDGLLSVLGDLLMFIYLFFPWIFSWIMRVCVSIICYTRVIEIYARATFAPIALSDFFHSGLQGSGWRFLKSFLAVCLQGGMILVIAAIYTKLFIAITTGVTWSSLFPTLCVFLAFYASAIMLMFKSLSLTKELLGVN